MFYIFVATAPYFYFYGQKIPVPIFGMLSLFQTHKRRLIIVLRVCAQNKYTRVMQQSIRLQSRNHILRCCGTERREGRSTLQVNFQPSLSGFLT